MSSFYGVPSHKFQPSMYRNSDGQKLFEIPDGELYFTRTVRFKVFCGSNRTVRNLGCCAEWEHNQDCESVMPSESDFRRMLSSDGWRLKNGVWWCPSCFRVRG